MHPSIQPLYTQFILDTRLFLNTLADIDDKTSKICPTEQGNHMLFVACHALDARYYIARLLGIDTPCPFQEMFDQARNIHDMKTYPLLDELKADWQKIADEMAERLINVDESILKEKSELSLPIEDQTKLGELAFFLAHESYHIGQLGLLRRQVGLEAMTYS